MKRSRFLNTTSPMFLGSTSSARRNQGEVARSHRKARVWLDSPILLDLASGEMGIVITNPVVPMHGGGMHIKNAELDPLELRRSLLYWDKLVWPRSQNIYIGHSADIDFLENAGVLTRPLFGSEGDESIGFQEVFVETYSLLEKSHPGQWAMSSLTEELVAGRSDFAKNRGVLMQLFRAIPIPMRDVPFEDIIRFRESYRDELLQLRFSIGDFYQSWMSSEDRDHQLAQAIARIDVSCRDAIRAARSSALEFGLASLKVNFSFKGDDAVRWIVSTIGAKSFGLDMVSSAMVGATSFLSFSGGLGEVSPSLNAKSFSYASSVERELG